MPLRLALVLFSLVVLACGPADVVSPPPAAPPVPAAPRAEAPPAAVEPEPPRAESPPAPPPPAPKPAADERTVWRVPVGGSPVRGKASALVTMVEIADFQCPFCGRAAPTVKRLEGEYGDKLRIVFKHNPLPFHVRAEPAAELALEARAQKGEKGFWAAHDVLYAKECLGGRGAERQACMDAGGTWLDHQLHLEDQDLIDYAKGLGLDASKVQAAIAGKKHAASIEEDQGLADDLDADVTPYFFVNGRRIVGAEPIERFRAVIDEELARAQQVVKQGVPAAGVYEKILSTARIPQAFEQRTVPAPTAGSPARGPAGARVVVQVFSNFQCPYCRSIEGVIEDLEKTFPGKIRVVWRNLLPSPPGEAALAAEAAMEAFRQKGDAGFWAMHALLAHRAMDRAALEGHAGQLGLDAAQFAAALDTRAQRARVEADTRMAADAHVGGEPAFVINGYYLSGSQRRIRIRRVVARALAEAK